MEDEKKLIQYVTNDNENVFIEITDLDYGSSIQPASRVKDKLYKSAKNLEESLDVIKPISKAFVAKIKGLANPPKEVEVEFGLKVTLSAGVIIASSSSDFNFNIKLKWSNEKL